MSSSTSLSSNALVLVTGAGGYVGSAVSWQLLKQGFKVKGTTRTASKLDLFKQKADKEFGAGKFEAVEIADLSVKGALDDALKGEWRLVLRSIRCNTLLMSDTSVLFSLNTHSQESKILST